MFLPDRIEVILQAKQGAARSNLQNSIQPLFGVTLIGVHERPGEPLYPRLGERFRQAVVGMGRWLDTDSRHGAAAKEIIRGLVQQVFIFSGTGGERPMEVTGNLGALVFGTVGSGGGS